MAEERDDGKAPGFKVTDKRRAGREEPSGTETKEGPKTEAPPPPPIDFSMFVLSLASTAMVHLGLAPDPETGAPREAAPELARETIDLLGMLREKTRGNLTDEEQKFLDTLLYDLRMQFVEATRKKS